MRKTQNWVEKQIDPNRKLEPNNEELEFATLGCVLSGNEKLLDDLRIDMFYSRECRELFLALQNNYHAKGVVDLALLKDEAILNYARECKKAYDPSGKIKEVAVEELSKYSNSREILARARDIISLAESSKIDDAIKLASGITQIATTDRLEYIDLNNLDQLADIIYTASSSSGLLPMGVSSGYGWLDQTIGLLNDGEIFTLTAEPAGGKTTMMMDMCFNISQDRKVAVFAFDMRDQLIIKYQLALRNGVRPIDFLGGKFEFSRDTAKLYSEAIQSNIILPKIKSTSIDWLIKAMKYCVKTLGVRFFAIDYLTKVQGQGESERVQISNIMSRIDEFAKEFQVPVLLVSQMNRDKERQRNGRKPTMADLYGSAAIDMVSANVLAIYRNKDQDDKFYSVTHALLLKVRYGEGTDHFYARLRNGKFEQMSKEEAQKIEGKETEGVKKYD